MESSNKNLIYFKEYKKNCLLMCWMLVMLKLSNLTLIRSNSVEKVDGHYTKFPDALENFQALSNDNDGNNLFDNNGSKDEIADTGVLQKINVRRPLSDNKEVEEKLDTGATKSIVYSTDQISTYTYAKINTQKTVNNRKRGFSLNLESLKKLLSDDMKTLNPSRNNSNGNDCLKISVWEFLDDHSSFNQKLESFINLFRGLSIRDLYYFRIRKDCSIILGSKIEFSDSNMNIDAFKISMEKQTSIFINTYTKVYRDRFYEGHVGFFSHIHPRFFSDILDLLDSLLIRFSEKSLQPNKIVFFLAETLKERFYYANNLYLNKKILDSEENTVVNILRKYKGIEDFD